MRYNYVVCGADTDLMKFCYSDLSLHENAIVQPSIDSLLGPLLKLQKFHLSNKVNSICRLPLKGIWNGLYVKGIQFTNDKPICFILCGVWVKLAYDLGLSTYLQKKFPECKLVWFSQDMICIQKPYYGDGSKHMDIDKCKELFDIILSFDQGDCEKYDLVYHPLVYSSFHGAKKQLAQSDIFFCAKAKDRLPEILRAYEKLRSFGLKLDFYLTGVDPEDQLFSNEITYGKGMTYEEYIQHVLSTRCLLEIMQQGGRGYTLRGNEAVCLNKKLLTNNPCIKEVPFYNPEYISTFSSLSADDIDEDFLKQLKNKNEVDYHYKEKMSPIELLEFIDDRL